MLPLFRLPEQHFSASQVPIFDNPPLSFLLTSPTSPQPPKQPQPQKKPSQ